MAAGARLLDGHRIGGIEGSLREQQARHVRDVIAGRLAEVGLELHPEKTRIIYCKDDDRRGDLEVTSFTFLGYEFRPRLAKNK